MWSELELPIRSTINFGSPMTTDINTFLLNLSPSALASDRIAAEQLPDLQLRKKKPDDYVVCLIFDFSQVK